MMKKSCGKSKEGDGSENYMNDFMCNELLVRIFMLLNIAEVATVSRVCKSWEKACGDPTLWGKVDLSALCSSPFNMPKILEDWADMKSIGRMNQLLKNTLSLGGANITCLVFNFYAFLTDQHLITAAQRTPNLERVILPVTGQLSKVRVEVAMKSWSKLQSITLTRIINNTDIFTAIGKYCKGITSLKLTCHCCFRMKDAAALIKHMPNLEFLSVQYLKLEKNALISILKHLEKLKVLNVGHNLITWNEEDDVEDNDNNNDGVVVGREYRWCGSAFFCENMLPSKYESKVVFCKGSNCVVCKKKARDENYDSKEVCEWLEDVWLIDDIQSLSH